MVYPKVGMEMLSLAEAELNRKLRVERINSGIRAKLRLSNLGVVPGVIIKKIQTAPFCGPVELEIENKGRLIIGYGLALKIQVSELN
ncbi:MAG: FeoA family protein [Promethearchaeota archaeon]